MQKQSEDKRRKFSIIGFIYGSKNENNRWQQAA